MHCNHLPSAGLCKVFELGIDRANEVELFFAPPAFELFFPSDGCANVFVTFKVEQALAAIGRSETFQRPRGKRRLRPVRASVVEKVRAAWVR
jgi:hypothetical protein